MAIEPIGYDELNDALNACIERDMMGNTKSTTGLPIDALALKRIKQVAESVAAGNSPFDCARLWVAVGVLLSERRRGGPSIIIPGMYH